MEHEYEENGLVEEENKKEEFNPTWRKFFSWVAFVLSIITPPIALGIAFICLSTPDEKEKEQVKLLSYIAIAISLFLLISQLISGRVLAQW